MLNNFFDIKDDFNLTYSTLNQISQNSTNIKKLTILLQNEDNENIMQLETISCNISQPNYKLYSKKMP